MIACMVWYSMECNAVGYKNPDSQYVKNCGVQISL